MNDCHLAEAITSQNKQTLSAWGTQTLPLQAGSSVSKASQGCPCAEEQ